MCTFWTYSGKTPTCHSCHGGATVPYPASGLLPCPTCLGLMQIQSKKNIIAKKKKPKKKKKQQYMGSLSFCLYNRQLS